MASCRIARSYKATFCQVRLFQLGVYSIWQQNLVTQVPSTRDFLHASICIILGFHCKLLLGKATCHPWSLETVKSHLLLLQAYLLKTTIKSVPGICSLIKLIQLVRYIINIWDKECFEIKEGNIWCQWYPLYFQEMGGASRKYIECMTVIICSALLKNTDPFKAWFTKYFCH